jgi:hypothetical protein
MADYRESLAPMLAQPFGYVDPTNPPPIAPGMVFEKIDGHGLLREFSAIPYDDSPAAPVAAEVVFHAAGLDVAAFHETTPTMLPRHAADEVHAWKGPHPVIPATELTVQIATWKGRVTQAEVEFPSPGSTGDGSPAGWRKIRGLFMMAAQGLAGFFGIMLARRNWKKERVDKRGALRIASFSFVLSMITWAGRVHPVASDDLFGLFFAAVGDSLLWSAMLWVLYLALEPAVRARWPHAIVTWNRILAGRWSDAQVASHILIGAAIGMGATAVFILRATWGNTGLDSGGLLWPLMSVRAWVASLAALVNSALYAGLLAFFAIFGLRVMLRKDWLAAIVASVLFAFGEGEVVNSPDVLVSAAMYVSIYVVLMFVLLRFGLVTTLSMIVFINSIERMVLGTDLRAWWAPYGLATMTVIIGFASYAFWRSSGTTDLTPE